MGRLIAGENEKEGKLNLIDVDSILAIDTPRLIKNGPTGAGARKRRLNMVARWPPQMAKGPFGELLIHGCRQSAVENRRGILAVSIDRNSACAFEWRGAAIFSQNLRCDPWLDQGGDSGFVVVCPIAPVAPARRDFQAGAEASHPHELERQYKTRRIAYVSTICVQPKSSVVCLPTRPHAHTPTRPRAHAHK
jgi:hypothetical protein